MPWDVATMFSGFVDKSVELSVGLSVEAYLHRTPQAGVPTRR